MARRRSKNSEFKQFVKLFKDCFGNALFLLAAPFAIIYFVQFLVTFFDQPTNQEWDFIGGIFLSRNIILLAFGVPVNIFGMSISLAPLGITLLIGIICYKNFAKSQSESFVGAFLVPLIFGALLAGFAAIEINPVEDIWIRIVTAFIKGFILVLFVTLTALFSKNKIPDLAEKIKLVKTSSKLIFTVFLIIGSVWLVIGTILGRPSAELMFSGLGIDIISGIILILLSLAYLPNLMIWSFSYSAGQGYYFGENQYFDLYQNDQALIPNFPILKSLPQTNGEFQITFDILGKSLIIVIGGLLAFYIVANILAKNERKEPNTVITSINDRTNSTLQRLSTNKRIELQKMPVSHSKLQDIISTVAQADLAIFGGCAFFSYVSSGSLGVNNLSFVGVKTFIGPLWIILLLLVGEIIVLGFFLIYAKQKNATIHWEL